MTGDPSACEKASSANGKLVFSDGEATLETKQDEALALVKDTLSKQAQILIFENSRRNAEASASKLCGLVYATPELRSAL